MTKNKFRGKRIETNEWVYGHLLKNENGSYIVSDFDVNNFYGDSADLYATEWYKVKSETVGQYTGLKDKNN